MYPLFEIDQQEEYSRGELLLRTFFGWIYITLPHAFILALLGIWSSILTFVAFWSILFTGRYPESMFEFQEKLLRWSTRLNAVTLNLRDGYPAFGLDAQHDGVSVEIPYPEHFSRGELILKVLFGVIYVLIPHGIILYFRFLITVILMIAAWFVVLFTGKYPEGMHEFNVGTLRWAFRVNLYMSLMTDRYPPFTGQPDEWDGDTEYADMVEGPELGDEPGDTFVPDPED
jgi:hypothetical protein